MQIGLWPKCVDLRALQAGGLLLRMPLRPVAGHPQTLPPWEPMLTWRRRVEVWGLRTSRRRLWWRRWSCCVLRHIRRGRRPGRQAKSLSRSSKAESEVYGAWIERGERQGWSYAFDAGQAKHLASKHGLDVGRELIPMASFGNFGAA